MYATKGMSVTELLGCLIRKAGILGIYNKGVAYIQYQEYEIACSILLKLAEQGDTRAQFDIGVMLHTGMGIEKDCEKAIYWFERSAEQNNAEADNYLGAIYKNGFGAPQDIEKALFYLKRASDRGNVSARKSLSELMAGGLPESQSEH